MKKLKKYLAGLLAAAMMFNSMGMVPQAAEAEPTVYYKDDFDSYENGADVSKLSGGLSEKGNGGAIVTAVKSDQGNGYLNFAGDANADYVLIIPFQQNGSAAAYADTATPLWIEMSISNEGKNPFRTWQIRSRDASGGGRTDLLNSGAASIKTNGTEIGTLTAGQWTKLIFKLDLSAKTYSVWVSEYAGDPAVTAALNSENVADLYFYVGSHSGNYNRMMMFDNIAVYASAEYQDIFAEDPAADPSVTPGDATPDPDPTVTPGDATPDPDPTVTPGDADPTPTPTPGDTEGIGQAPAAIISMYDFNGITETTEIPGVNSSSKPITMDIVTEGRILIFP